MFLQYHQDWNFEEDCLSLLPASQIWLEFQEFEDMAGGML